MPDLSLNLPEQSAISGRGESQGDLTPRNPAALTTVLFVFSMTLIPVLERLFLRDLIRRGEREGRKIEAVREEAQVRLEKKNHAR
jgi:hypothetical protein